jgi:hypothetical protein
LFAGARFGALSVDAEEASGPLTIASARTVPMTYCFKPKTFLKWLLYEKPHMPSFSFAAVGFSDSGREMRAPMSRFLEQ